jgi:hypothetical protein
MLDGLLRRVTGVAVSLSMVLTPLTAGAQTGPVPAGMADPPARVGRLAALQGTVSYHLADADRWEPAQVNLPVTSGTAIWTEPGSQAVVEAAATRLVLDQSTELEMQQLDDRSMVAALPQGRAFVQVQAMEPGDSAAVQTPRGSVALMRGGRYEVAAGDTGAPTVVTVLEGEAEMTVAGALVHVGPNEAATITGDGQGVPLEARLGPAVRDPFLTALLNEERPVRRPVIAPPPAVAMMTGGAELSQYGDWANMPEYGAVWYPPVEQGYVPYRQGRWAFVQPWGWTWIDDAPWGFAPSHYGRWAEFNHRWGWIPGAPMGPAYPVYAPAVVSFLAGAAVGVLAAGVVGWVPLGPREAYYPPYRVSDRYVRNLNVMHVRNVTNVVTTYNTRIVNNQVGGFPGGVLMNRSAATTAPVAAMVGSRNLAGLAQPVRGGTLPPNATFAVRPPVMPTQATLGVTPAVAQQLRLQPGEGGPARAAAPGPAMRSMGAPAMGGPVGGAVTGAGPGASPGAVTPQGGLPGGSGRPGLGALGGAAAGAAAGVAAGSMLRQAPNPAGGLPTIARPTGVAPPMAPGAAALPGLRAPGSAPGSAVDVLPRSGSGPAGGFPTITKPGGAAPMAPGAAALPGLREPGPVGGVHPGGGAPGPALPPRSGGFAPGAPGGAPLGAATGSPPMAPAAPRETPAGAAPRGGAAPAVVTPGAPSPMAAPGAAIVAPAPQMRATPPVQAPQMPAAPSPPARPVSPMAPPPQMRTAPPAPLPQEHQAPPAAPPPQMRAAPPAPLPQVHQAPPAAPPPPMRAAAPPAPLPQVHQAPPAAPPPPMRAAAPPAPPPQVRQAPPAAPPPPMRAASPAPPPQVHHALPAAPPPQMRQAPPQAPAPQMRAPPPAPPPQAHPAPPPPPANRSKDPRQPNG